MINSLENTCERCERFGGQTETEHTDDGMKITLEAPRYSPEDIHISIPDERMEDSYPDDLPESWACLNVNGRIVKIPKFFNVHQATANLKNGLLTLTIPKRSCAEIIVTGV